APGRGPPPPGTSGPPSERAARRASPTARRETRTCDGDFDRGFREEPPPSKAFPGTRGPPSSLARDGHSVAEREEHAGDGRVARPPVVEGADRERVRVVRFGLHHVAHPED